MTRPAIAITGYGMITSVGSCATDTWDALLAGRSGCGAITRFPAASFPVRIAAEVPREHWLQPVRSSLALTFAQRAIREALVHAGLPNGDLGPDVGLVVGVGGDDDGGRDDGFDYLDRLIAIAPDVTYERLGEVVHRVPPIGAAGIPFETIASALALQFGIEGDVQCVSTACASGAHAIAVAADLLREGSVRRVITVGTDAMINRLSLANFCALGVLSRRNDAPETACRPFDARRQGFVIGEGAGAIVLERIDDAPPSRTLGYLAGYGVSADAFSITDKESDGAGVALSIEQALTLAGARPGEVAYINAHGTGTRKNDPGEAAAIRRAFGADAPHIPISSIKGQIGHSIAAAGAIEMIVTLLSLTERRAPGTANLEIVGQEMQDLSILPPGVHAVDDGLGLSVSAGFGGVNVSLLVAGPERT